MNDEKKFYIPEAIIILFEDDLATNNIGNSGGDMGDPFDPDDPGFPGY